MAGAPPPPRVREGEPAGWPPSLRGVEELQVVREDSPEKGAFLRAAGQRLARLIHSPRITAVPGPCRVAEAGQFPSCPRALGCPPPTPRPSLEHPVTHPIGQPPCFFPFLP